MNIGDVIWHTSRVANSPVFGTNEHAALTRAVRLLADLYQVAQLYDPNAVYEQSGDFVAAVCRLCKETLKP